VIDIPSVVAAISPN